MPPWTIRYSKGGVHLPDLGLWLDPVEAQGGPERVFVSHAHADHIAAHREMILSEPTARLMEERLGGKREEILLPFGVAREFSGGPAPFRLTLFPAGHIFGSAMAYVESIHGTLLYTGDFKLRPGLSAELCEPRSADVLIMETTYGRPHYLFPPAEQVIQGIIRFCREALDQEETPVLLGYSLGKSQELLCALGDAGLPIMLHGEIYKLTKIYEKFGKCFPPYQRYERSAAAGHVLLCPPNASHSAMVRNLGRTRLAVLTGWAVDPSCRYRYQAHAAFPLSDHADFSELLELVRRVQPKQVYTLHGFAADFCRTLHDLGFRAEALSEPEQLALPLSVSLGAPPPLTSVLALRAPASAREGEAFDEIQPSEPRDLGGPRFLTFAQTCARIGSTSKKLEKIALLGAYLRELEGAALETVVTWLSGRPFPAVENKTLQLGWALIRDALCRFGRLDQAAFGQVYLKHSDLGETAAEILAQSKTRRDHLSIQQVDQFFLELFAGRGPSGKLPVLVRLLERSTPDEGKFAIKILTGDLRIGLKEGLVEEAIAAAFEVPVEEVKNANLLLSNISETAQLARRRALGTANLVSFRPVKYMLASPEGSGGEAWDRVREWASSQIPAATSVAGEAAANGEEGLIFAPGSAAWCEDKYDGIRCQLHKVGQRVELYSRDLKEISSTFYEIADAARSLPADFILDGEVVAMRENEILPFSELQRRLGRREADLFLSEEVPVRFVAFDLLRCGQENLLGQPLRNRRWMLEKLGPRPDLLMLSNVQVAHSAEEIEAAFREAKKRGNEGLMIKDPASPYTPGRRGLSWLKLKKAFGTLDCVVVGAEYGHGKRKSVLSDYTFAVRDEANGDLKTIGKAFSGLTDEEIGRLTQHFLSKTIRQYGRYFEVVPDTVLEIAFDAIQPSARHSSGLALRFPRIVRIRSEKSVGEIDTLSAARKLAEREGAE